MEILLFFFIRGYEKYLVKLYYFFLLEDMNLLNILFYFLIGYVCSWKGEGKKKIIFIVVFSDF